MKYKLSPLTEGVSQKIWHYHLGNYNRRMGSAIFEGLKGIWTKQHKYKYNSNFNSAMKIMHS